MDVKSMLDEKSQVAYNELVFPVEKVAVEDIINIPAKPVSGLSHAIVVRGSQIINFCSDEYHLRTNQDIIHQIGNIVNDMGLSLELRGSRFKSNRFRIDFSIPSLSLDLGTKMLKDPITAAIQVFNSYDGTQGFSISIIIYRLVCKNGMVLPDPILNIKKIHTGQLLDFIDISEEKIREGVSIMKDTMEDAIQYYYDLMDFGVKPRLLESFVDDIIEVVDFPRSLRGDIIARIEEEVKMGFPLTNWLVYNGFNYAINHLNSTLIGRKGRKLDTAIMQHLLGI